VARALKYHSPDTDLAALQRELGGRVSDETWGPDHGASADPDADEDDEFVENGGDNDDVGDGDDGGWATRRS
jgi:hypothetical protein